METKHTIPTTLDLILTTQRPAFSEHYEYFHNTTLWAMIANRKVTPSTDNYGNLWVTTDPTSETLFTCHTDTCHDVGGHTQAITLDERGVISLAPVKRSQRAPRCLGADDGAAIWLLLEMVAAGVPGTYVFFMDEERGGLGSAWAAEDTDTRARLSKFKRAVAFDRKGTSSVITHQAYGRCCSDAFAQALADSLTTATPDLMFLPDSTGVFTDTANLTHLIPECTNVSVGYENEHTPKETLNLPYLLALRDACVTLDWESLPVVRTTEDDMPDTLAAYDRDHPTPASTLLGPEALAILDMDDSQLDAWIRDNRSSDDLFYVLAEMRDCINFGE